MSPSRCWPPGRRYATSDGPRCADCEHWHIDPDSLAIGLCFYTAPDAPKRTPSTMECHTCDQHKPRRLALIELSIDGKLAELGCVSSEEPAISEVLR